MSEDKPPPKTKENADPPTTKADDAGFSIKLIDNLEEGETKDGIKAIMASNAILTEKITKMETERHREIFEKQRNERLDQLKQLDVRIFEKHKEEMDIGRLDLLIDTAKEYANNFPKYQADKDKKDPQKIPTHRNPRSGKLE